MINKIIWKKNTKIREELMKAGKTDLISELDLTFDNIEILLNKNNIITSGYDDGSNNTVGKTMLLHSLQYVLGEHKNGDDDSLIKIINNKYLNFLLNPKEHGENNFLFSYDIYIEYISNGVVYKLMRMLNFNPDSNKPYSATERWQLNNVGKNTVEIINREKLMNNVLPTIFESWPDSYGYKSLKLEKEKKKISSLGVQTYRKLSVHQYNQFFYKKQFQSTDKTSMPSFFARYPFWSEVQYRSVIYSLFSNDLKNEILSYKLLGESEKYNTIKIDIEKLKIKEKALSKEMGRFDSGNHIGIDKKSIADLKKIMSEIDEISERIQPHLNDFYTKSNKINFDIDSALTKIYDDNFSNSMDIEAKILIERYLILVKSLRSEWEKRKASNSNDLMIALLILESKGILEGIKESIKNKEDEMSENYSLHSKNYEIIRKISNEIGEKINKFEGETGAEFNINETKSFVDIITNSNRNYPYLFIDEFLSAVDDVKKKDNDIIEPLQKIIIQKPIFNQTILTTAKISERVISEKFNTKDSTIITIGKQLFKEECESEFVLQS